MVRELKFRVWDKNSKTMMVAFPHSTSWELQNEPFVTMQYTGIEDKNGKQIYEGDIVQTKDWHTDADGRCILSEANSYMKRTVIKYSREFPFVGFAIQSKTEVIGNIYENPELLESSK